MTRGSRPPRVLLVTHYFPPEVGAPQARLSETAQAWAADGLDVTVLTGMPNHPTGVVQAEYRRALRRIEHTDGYRVVRTWLYTTPNEGVLRKTLGHLSFMVTSVVLGGRTTGPADVVVVSSPTFFAIGSAWVLARLRRARLVVEVRDLWPAIFVQLDVITNKRVIAALERLELAAYRAADAVVTVTEGFREDIVGRGIAPAKVHTIPNGVDLARFSSAPRPGTNSSGAGSSRTDRSATDDRGVGVPGTRQRLGARPGDLLVLYVGTHGISQGLVSVADAADRLARESAPVHFAFVGEGADKQRLAMHVAKLGLTNVTLHPAVPRDEVPALLAAADICLVPLRDVPLFETFIPSKMFELMAAGRPVIGSVRGEAARILAEAGALVAPPEDPDALADAIRTLATSPTRRAEMGRASRAHMTAHFDRTNLAQRYRDLILCVLSGDLAAEGVVPDETAPRATAGAPRLPRQRRTTHHQSIAPRSTNP